MLPRRSLPLYLVSLPATLSLSYPCFCISHILCQYRLFSLSAYISSLHLPVSDYVADIVMSSWKTCNMNQGSCWEGKGRVGSKGWAVSHQPRTSVDGHSHHDHQKGVVHLKGGREKGKQGEGLDSRTIFMKYCTHMYCCTWVHASNECCV